MAALCPQAEAEAAAEGKADGVVRRLASHVADLQAERRLTNLRVLKLEREAIRAMALEQERDFTRSQLDLVLQSSWWRAGAPLRNGLSRLPGLRRVLRRSARLFWWTISLQLPARLRDRRTRADTAQRHEAPPADEKAAFTAAARADLAEFLLSGQTLDFAPVTAADISIVIVLWNKAHLTLRCLRALAAAPWPLARNHSLRQWLDGRDARPSQPRSTASTSSATRRMPASFSAAIAVAEVATGRARPAAQQRCLRPAR